MQAKSNASQGAPQAFRSDEGKSQNVDTMLDFNALQYEMFPDLSVVTDRTHKRHPFQKNSYNLGESAFVVVNSGADFIDTRNSYLLLELSGQTIVAESSRAQSNDAPAVTPHFNPLGSVLDLIESITLTDRAGNEIERIQDAGRLANLLVRNSYSDAWMSTYGKSLGFTPSSELTTSDYPTEETFDEQTTPHRYPTQHYTERTRNTGISMKTVGTPVKAKSKSWAIPLRLLCGFFDYNQLMPSHVMSGLRIEIRFNTFNNAFQADPFTAPPQGIFPARTATHPTTHGVIIGRAELVLDSVKLTDSIQRELNERAANDGLEIMFRTWHTSSYTSTSSGDYHVEVRKAVSRAFGALAVFRPSIPTADKLASDHNATNGYAFKHWQWRAGNLYFPHQRMENRLTTNNLSSSGEETEHSIVTLVTPGAGETFNHLQRLFGKHVEQNAENAMNSRFFAHKPTHPLSIIPLDLERTTVQDLSGIPLNNSRVLALDFGLEEGAGQSGTVSIYLQHLKIARVFMDNTEIEE